MIHLAFKHEGMREGAFMRAVDADLAAVQALGAGLIGTDKPFVTTGGTLMLAMAGITGRPGTEDDQSEGGPRIDAANHTIGLAKQGVRSSVVRLAPMVHSDLDHHGFTHALIGFARENGVAAYTGDGANRWPAANTYDIGVLYRLALEKAPAGSTLHGVGDTGIPRKVIAETIARKLGVEAKSITDEEAPQYLGFLAAFAGFDNPTSNDKTRELLGWEPTHPGWVEDVETGHYFALAVGVFTGSRLIPRREGGNDRRLCGWTSTSAIPTHRRCRIWSWSASRSCATTSAGSCWSGAATTATGSCPAARSRSARPWRPPCDARSRRSRASASN